MPKGIGVGPMDPGGPIPQAPKTRVDWMMWVWLAFLLVVVVLTVVGFMLM